MRELSIIERLLRIIHIVIIVFFFALSTNFIYSQGTAYGQDKSLSGNFSKDDPGLQLAEKFGNQVLLNSQIAQSDYAQSNNGETSSSITTLSSNKSRASDWYFSLAPYAWMLSLNGNIGVKGQIADVNMSFGDLFDQAEFAGQLHGELFYKNKYGLFLDVTYVKLNTDSVMGPIVANTTTKVFMFEFAGMYRVYSSPTSYAESKGYEKSSINVDLLLGGRYYNIDNKINFRSQGPMNIPSVSGDEGWFDFMAGGRVIWQATDRWSLIGRTDFGGFDFNFSSTFSWNGVGFVGFDATDWLDILLGFRALYTDYSDGKGDNRFVFDTWLYGPVIGLNFHN